MASLQVFARLAVSSVFDWATLNSVLFSSPEAFIATSSANNPTSIPSPIATKISGVWNAKNANVTDPRIVRVAKTDIVFFVLLSLRDRSVASRSLDATGAFTEILVFSTWGFKPLEA
jgi:hypothetical protein